MKKLNTLLLASLLFGSIVSFSGCADDEIIVDPPEINESTLAVEFGDARIEAFIKAELEMDPTDTITRGDLTALTVFDIEGVLDLVNVESLVGLEYATELTEINFGGTQVSDLTPLENLENVTYLRMHEAPVEDLSPVGGYTTLTYFNANQAGSITDISPLAGNVGLQELILRGNPLGNEMMETIGLFVNLDRLNVRATGLTDITVLGELMAQGALLNTVSTFDEDSELDISDNDIENLAPIQPYIDNGTIVPYGL